MRRTANRRFHRALRPMLFAAAALAAAPAAAEDNETAHPWFVGVFGGFGLNTSFSQIFVNPFGMSRTEDYIAVVTVGREVGRVFDRRLSFELEGMYAYHFGRQEFHEFSTTAYARWHRFPWNRSIDTTLAFGIGPRYVTEEPLMETDKGWHSKILNQLNVEITGALPEYPDDQLVIRLQHRSGIFGLIDGVRDGSNFVTLGYKRYF
ncbi:MAG: hypothetical protein AB7F67_09970 [Rhodospirillaceae bacterium]